MYIGIITDNDGEYVLIDLKLTTEEVNIILAALGKAPYEIVAQLVHNIRIQAQPQAAALEDTDNGL